MSQITKNLKHIVKIAREQQILHLSGASTFFRLITSGWSYSFKNFILSYAICEICILSTFLLYFRTLKTTQSMKNLMFCAKIHFLQNQVNFLSFFLTICSFNFIWLINYSDK
jgi:hypothetical protein